MGVCVSCTLQKSKVDTNKLAMPEFHEKMKHANKTRNQWGVAVLYRFSLYNVCATHALFFFTWVAGCLLKMCVFRIVKITWLWRTLATLYQNWSSQYQIQIHINRSQEIKQSTTCTYESGRDSDWLSYMYGYFEPRTARPPDLVVSVANYGDRGPDSNSEWAPNIYCFLLLF